MANRLPLTANKEKKRIEELASGDNLDLAQSGIVNAVSIESQLFIGNLSGTATTAINLTNAENILDGIIDPARLTGEYDIDISGTANSLLSAANIEGGIINPDRLTGTYNIDITGTALGTENAKTIEIELSEETFNYYPIFAKINSNESEIEIQKLYTDKDGLFVYNPGSNRLGVSKPNPEYTLDVGGDINSVNYFGSGVNLVGIVTQVIPSIGINIKSTQPNGKGVVTIDAYKPVGKTIYVSQNGNDSNTGLSENHPKRSIKSAASIALFGDTIKVFPGVYVEENPIILGRKVSIEGTELRNVVITPKYPNLDLFYVNNSCHITDASFIGPEMTEGSAIVSFQPLLGVSTDRYFDAARMLRMNLDFIAKESVGYAKSQFSLNNTVSVKCEDDLKKIWKCIIHDITRGGNSRSYAAGLAYYDEEGNLIPSFDANPSEITQTIETLEYSFNIARSVINNCSWGSTSNSGVTTVSNAVYDNVTGIVTITSNNHNLIKNSPVKIEGLEFTCPSGPGIVTYPSGTYGYIFPVKDVLDANTFEVVVGQSTLPHTYNSGSGGTIQKYNNYQNVITQVRDLSIQSDPVTGFNNSINSCVDVISAVRSCVGVVTSVLLFGELSSITPRYPGNCGIGFTTVLPVTNAIYYDETDQNNLLLQGFLRLTVPGLNVKVGDRIEIRDLKFNSNSQVKKIPSGIYGNEFYVCKINEDSSFDIFIGVATAPHSYIGNTGYVVDRSISITNALYDEATGITTITAPGAYVKVGDIVRVRDLVFSYDGNNNTYPSGVQGYDFKVTQVPVFGESFTINIETSNDPQTYVSGGIVFPSYSKGVGPITQGPYIRNCTNFIPKSIGLKVDGFNAEPGEQDDNGVTGSMSVDSYTQYNQGGIGVSITNGAYSQLVSIYTICDDIAIYTGSGGQCDLTNSNSSFGNYGLYSSGVGGSNTKSIYRYTGEVQQTVNSEDLQNDRVVISGIGSNRPYDGQAIYFGELYSRLDRVEITDGGSGYSDENPPQVIIDAPTGPNGITAELLATVVNGKVISVDIIGSGNQYQTIPNISFSGGGGNGASATAVMAPIYYNIESATEPISGISTVVLTTPLNNTVTEGTTVYFSRMSLQLATTISFEWVGSGTNINKAKPSLGGVAIDENEVYKELGGQVIYTSTNQAGNFKVGDGVYINQLTGTISGRAYNQSVLTTVTPLIIALG